MKENHLSTILKERLLGKAWTDKTFEGKEELIKL